MYLMKGAFMLFMSLGIGYVLCVLAQKQEGLLKTLGYTLGIAIIALSLMATAVESSVKFASHGKSFCNPKAMKCYHGTNLSK
ncbi:MAG: hypothetical protein Q8R38_02150 [Candidatus Omnitrophota bacterium]|nr:hypothetical protein [Candidatus Omnitrophota bacterium]